MAPDIQDASSDIPVSVLNDKKNMWRKQESSSLSSPVVLQISGMGICLNAQKNGKKYKIK